MDPRWIDPARPTLLCDTECYVDYWLIALRHYVTRQVAFYEFHADSALDRASIASLFRKYRIVTFNGIYYDMPMITAALAGFSNANLKRLSDEIIVGQMKPWEFEREYDLKIPEVVDHVDLIEPSFGDAGLKLYGGRMHSKRLQDLPIEPEANISPEQRPLLRLYCANDLDITSDLLTTLAPDISLRERMSKQYGVDLRSKSDAQMGEAILKKKIEQAIGRKLEKPNIRPGATFKYRPPSFVQFSTPECRAAFQRVLDAEFVVQISGKAIVPLWGETGDDGEAPPGSPRVIMGGATYRMGYGGLHSSEESICHYTTVDDSIEDDDVSSYYPELMRLMKLAPSSVGQIFVDIFADILDTRLRAKAAGDKDTSQTLKITANGGGFGKTGSKWSVFFAPDVMMQVTITGQLCLLMLIEAFVRYDIPVISANTDGVITKCPRSKLELKAKILQRWGEITGLSTETTKYKAVFSRDVNNYLALKESGGFKGKGAYNDISTVEAKLAKNPTALISIDAVRAFLEHGVPITYTIHQCRDIRRFVSVRQVNGGALYQGQLLGKVVRWYYGIGRSDAMHYKTIRYGKADKEFFEAWGVYPEKIGNKVPVTDGCVPCLELPDELPNDIDHVWYVRRALTILKEIGYDTRNRT